MLQVENSVFICYRRTDEPWAVAVYQDLSNHGYNVRFQGYR